MRIFSTESMWDKNEQKFVEYYFIDEKEVSLEEYDEAMQEEVIEEEDDCNGDCENCCGCNDEYDDEIPCPKCVTDMYVEMLEDVDCPHCRKELLTHFFFDMVESIANQEKYED